MQNDATDDIVKKGVVIGGSESGSQNHHGAAPGQQLQLRHKQGYNDSPSHDENSQFSQSGIDGEASQAAPEEQAKLLQQEAIMGRDMKSANFF